ncbi:MAG: hypothetical protein H0Z35_13205 [Thermoanaerobacteraceae bacterium]|nr:hypothetical protein [Thermoanaerobacteraceae bacterium]
MDKISWRDDLGTFGDNTNFNVPEASANTFEANNEVIETEKEFSIVKVNSTNILENNIDSIEALTTYKQKRLKVLKQLTPSEVVYATVTFNKGSLSEVLKLIRENNIMTPWRG